MSLSKTKDRNKSNRIFFKNYCSGKDNENPTDKNRESIINGQTYYHTLLSKKCGKKKL